MFEHFGVAVVIPSMQASRLKRQPGGRHTSVRRWSTLTQGLRRRRGIHQHGLFSVKLAFARTSRQNCSRADGLSPNQARRERADSSTPRKARPPLPSPATVVGDLRGASRARAVVGGSTSPPSVGVHQDDAPRPFLFSAVADLGAWLDERLFSSS